MRRSSFRLARCKCRSAKDIRVVKNRQYVLGMTLNSVSIAADVVQILVLVSEVFAETRNRGRPG